MAPAAGAGARVHPGRGRFVGILGYEWSAFTNRGGHHNVFFRDLAAERVGMQIATRLPDLYRELHRRYRPEDVLIIPHAHRAGDWTRSDPELERLVELHSVHGSFEWFANRYLQNGFELGFVGASDDHMAKPGLAPAPISSVAQPGGLAAVRVAESSRDAIFSALRDLRSYATSGQRLLLDATLNGHAMGTRQPATDRREISFTVAGTAPIDRIDVVRNGEVIHSRSYLDRGAGRARAWCSSRSSRRRRCSAPPSTTRAASGRGAARSKSRARPSRACAAAGSTTRCAIGWSGIAATPQTARFAILTRGRADSILLDLEGATAQTRIHLQLEAAKEAGAASTLRPLHDIPAADVTLALDDLRDGRLEHRMPPWASTSIASRSRWSTIGRRSTSSSTTPTWTPGAATTTTCGSRSSTARARGPARSGSVERAAARARPADRINRRRPGVRRSMPLTTASTRL